MVEGTYEQNTWYKSGKEVCVVSLVAEQRSRYKTGREVTETIRQVCVAGWSGLQGWRHRDGHSQDNTNWGECVEENGRSDGS